MPERDNDIDERPEPRGSATYFEILGRLQRGQIGAHERLVDTNLAVELNVSRMPVREALLRLVHEGYLVGTSRGFRLPQLSVRDIEEIFEVRRLLEPRAAAAAAQVIGELGLATMESAVEAAANAEASDDPMAFMNANRVFRQAWLKAVPNKRLAGTISRFVDHVQTVRIATLHDHSSQQLVVSLLRGLMVSFRDRDILKVQDSMAQFVDTARQRFFALSSSADQAIQARKHGT